MSSTKTQFSSSNKPSQAEIQPGLEVDNPKMLAALVSEHSKLIMKIAETEAKKAVAFERVKDMRADAKQVEDIESMLEALITNPKFEARAKRGMEILKARDELQANFIRLESQIASMNLRKECLEHGIKDFEARISENWI